MIRLSLTLLLLFPTILYTVQGQRGMLFNHSLMKQSYHKLK